MKGEKEMVSKSRFRTKADDTMSIKSINYDEIDPKEEEWYYDETDMVWKRNPGDGAFKRIVSFAMPFRQQFPSSGNAFRLFLR
jgi:hypothetical protein